MGGTCSMNVELNNTALYLEKPEIDGSVRICILFSKCYYNDEVNEGAMGGICSIHGEVSSTAF
jgi:hypothetical protein